MSQSDALQMIALAGDMSSHPWENLKSSFAGADLWMRVTYFRSSQPVLWRPPKPDNFCPHNGQRQKARDAPILPLIENAIQQYIQAAPFDFKDDDPLFRGVEAVVFRRQVQMIVEKCRRSMGLQIP